MKRFLSMLCAMMLLCALGAACAEEIPAGEAAETASGAEPVYIRIAVRDFGDIYAELYPDVAPITVENFMGLVNRNFYDGLTFHRIISSFMIQGGDPLGNGTGGSGQNIKGEFSANGVENKLAHTRGVLSMARSSDMNSASSQFFIMHQNASHLDGQYAAFGKVVAGMWVVDKICQAACVQDNNGTVLAADQPVMETVRPVDRQEAMDAAAREAMNGLDGAPFEDRLTQVSFSLPEGWILTGDQAGQAVFSNPENQRTLIYRRSNQWDRLPAAYKEYFAQQGQTRKDMSTEAYTKESMLNLITSNLNADDFIQETHSGILFYTGEVTDSNATYACFVGARDAYVYLFLYNAPKTDAHYADVTAVLDGLLVAE